jgi:DNA topoisomerase-2
LALLKNDIDNVNIEILYTHMVKSNIKNKEYTQLSARNHIIKRPETYLGECVWDDIKCLIIDDDDKMLYKKLKINPGLGKIFDEIIVNAKDATVNNEDCDAIEVFVDKDDGSIMVYNNGSDIRIEEYKKGKNGVTRDIWTPTLIFGVLNTSNNYNDDVERYTGGKNGLGAKLANVFSKKFEITVTEIRNDKFITFEQKWKNNMSREYKPKITEEYYDDNNDEHYSYISIKFWPDIEKFEEGNSTGLSDDMISFYKKRTYDIAMMNSDVYVYWNDKKIEQNSLLKYAKMMYEDKKQKFYCQNNDLWDVLVTVDVNNGTNVSFVNGVYTKSGGKHVEYIVNQLFSIIKTNTPKSKKVTITKKMIKDHITIFVNASVPNPTFGSQSKDKLTTNINKLGKNRIELDPKIFKKLIKDMKQVFDLANMLNIQKNMKKSDGRKTTSIRGIDKLEDANNAGSKHSKECTLIIVEGDSAKSLAMTGRSIMKDFDNWGVYPLRGKVLNVKKSSISSMEKNEVISDIKKILGLVHGKVYNNTNINTLRYGKVMMLMDQDVDGFHIKSLVTNLFHTFWPSLIKMGYIMVLPTPIVKIFRGNTDVAVETFYSLNDYESWIENTTDSNKYRIKYYKGLGTSTDNEGEEYFDDIENKSITIKPLNDESMNNNMNLAFGADTCSDRKNWLMNTYNEKNVFDYKKSKISIDDQINKELIHFSHYDTSRSLVSMVDGLKISQRKILYGCMLKGLYKPNANIKVAQLSGYISEKTCYHHGEDSLNGAIIKMAQEFCGSNNLALLLPKGQFGSRLSGGKDSASPRYIFTALNKCATKLFRLEDNPILPKNYDDGIEIEPKFYVPVLPLLLVNGALGIGTGFSTTIPAHDVSSIIESFRHMINSSKENSGNKKLSFLDLDIDVVDFDGSYNISKTGYDYYGNIELMDNDNYLITELPVGMWTSNYKKKLESLESSGKIKIVKDSNTSKKIKIEISILDNKIANGIDSNNDDKMYPCYKKLNLITSIKLGNMHAYDDDCNIKKYKSIVNIMEEFSKVRIEYYHKRKEYMIKNLQFQIEVSQMKYQFIHDIIKGDLIIYKNGKNKNKTEILDQLEELNYKDINNDNFDSLIKMSIISLSVERANKLKNQVDKLKKELEILKSTDILDIWLNEIGEFEVEYNKYRKDRKKRNSKKVKSKKSKTKSKK